MDLFIKRLGKLEEGIVGFVLLAICIFTFVETMLRYTISYTFPWFQEVANYTIIFFTYLGAAVGIKYGSHFSMEALTEFVADRFAHLLKACAFFLSAVVAVLFVVYGFEHVGQIRSYGVKSPAMQMPMFIPYLSIPLFSIIMAVRFFLLSVKHLRSFSRGEPFQRVRGKG